MASHGPARLFTSHPASVGESYGEHFLVALRYAGLLFAAGFCALVHALLPFAFEKTASTMVRRMVQEMDSRKARAAASMAPDTAPRHS